MKQGSAFERCFQRLQSGQVLTAQKIADLYDINIRSAYRTIQAMEAALPVRSFGTMPRQYKLMEK